MPIIGLSCRRGFRTIDECLYCPSRCIHAASIQELKSKMESGYFQPKDNEYHVTSLLGCPRKMVLDSMCGTYVKPINVWKMQLGTLGHGFMEDNPPSPGLIERSLGLKFEIPLAGKTYECKVVGRFDFYSFSDQLIHDYKFVWGTGFVPSVKHFKQLATYYILAVKSGAFRPDELLGGQVDYIDVYNGCHHPYRTLGQSFKSTVEQMEKDIPRMLTCLIRAKVDGVLPNGEPEMDECDYCSPDFKVFCDSYNKNERGLDSIKVVMASVSSYRLRNTPSDDEE